MRNRTPSPVRLTAAIAAAAALTFGGLVPAAHAAELDLEGSGATRDPYQIATADDLLAASEAINTDPGGFAGSSYRLVADIDFEGAEFTGIDTFTGTFEGAGHTISDIVYAPSEDDDSLGLIRHLDGGVVRGLTLEHPTADAGETTSFIGGIAVYGVEATMTGNSIVDAEFTAANSEKVGGMIAEIDSGVISDNWVSGTFTANEMPAGIAAYAKGETRISHNIVSGDLTMLTGGGETGNKGNDAGFIVGYPGTPNSGTFTQNVAYGGTIAAEGRIDGFIGRILGFTAYDGWTAVDNVANAAITIGGETVEGPGTRGQHGTDITADELAVQATYEQLGFDFLNAWTWDDELGRPAPHSSYSLFGAGTAEAPFEIGTEEDLEYLAAQLNTGNPKYAGDAHYVLTADLDLTGREPFAGIDLFEGALDGAGHTISGLTYTASESSGQLGFIRELSGGAVRELTIDAPVADQQDGTDWVAGLAVIATDSTIERVTVRDATFTATAAEKVAGLVAELHGASTVHANLVTGEMSAARMPAGLIAYATGSSEISENLVEADLTVAQPGTERGTDAALIVAYPGNGNDIRVERNVALGGSIAYSGDVPGFVGRILGYLGDENYAVTSLADNLALDTLAIAGEPVTGSAGDQNGADTTAAALAEQATYEDLGWDFATDWSFDDELGHPVPKYVSADAAPNRIATTFYGESGTGRGFSWYSEAEGPGTVRISTDREFPAAATTEVTAEPKQSQHGEQFFQAAATELKAGTTYYYRVGNAAEQIWSGTGEFVTPDGESDFTFIDLTDTQSQNVDEAALSAETMAKSLQYVPEAEFMVHSGDVVEHGDVEQDWKDMLGSAESTLLSTTLAPASGNHDQATNAFVDHFALEAPNGQDTATGAYYSFDYNDAHIAVLNTNEDPDQSVSDEQLSWLREDVTQARENGAKWVLVSMHKGAYTTATHLDDGDVIGMREALVPLLDELGIDLVMQGHDHVIARSKSLLSDPEGVAGAAVEDTTVITEMKGGKRIEYAVDPEGTTYFLPNTAGAKHYGQATEVGGGIDLEAYLDMFDRTEARSTENFAAVTIEDERLTVDVYDIRDRGVPRVFESFGFDREVPTVRDRVAALPEADAVTLGDEQAITEVRAAVDGLSSAQREVVDVARLEAAEARLRELQGLVSTDGSTVAWANPDATGRQTITVTNDTRDDVTNAPVRVRIENTPDVEPGDLALHGADGAPLSYEVEAWRPGGASIVWVKVPSVPAGSSATVWAYYGAGDAGNDPADVWSEGYSLVEHLSADATAGDTRTDSTGSATARVVGGDLEATETAAGTYETRFGGARLEYGGDIGGDNDRLTVSSIHTLTDAQYAELTGTAPIVAKQSADESGNAAFSQGVDPAGAVANRFVGNSWEFSDVDVNVASDLPALGSPHLVTQTYDGMTYSVFIDGQEVHSEFLEYRTTLSDPGLPTTIGDFATGDGTIASPFTGTIDEVHIAGEAFTPAYEAFRYDTMFGDAVSVGAYASRDDEPVSLVIGTPQAGTALEAGIVEVTGTVSERADIAASVAGEDVFSETVDAGSFTIEVPVNPAGDQVIAFQATGESGKTATAEVPVTVADTTAPAEPELSESVSTAGAELTATPDTDDRERVEATFHTNELLTLDASNTTVRTGTTTDRTPEAIAPDAGTVTEELLPSVEGTDENPFQIYEVSLTEEQAAQDEFHVSWTGTGDDRTVSAWVYDNAAGGWILKDSADSPTGDEVTLDVTALAAENAVAEGTLRILVWRGMTAMPGSEGWDYTQMPDGGDYDWAFDHVPDTQLYAQATPELMVDQFQYIADVAEERKTEIILQAGDLVNRPYPSQRYQFEGAEPAVKAWEDAGIPYLISWGNHDYDDARNNRQLLPEYYPYERFEASLEGSPFTLGGTFDIDNYYYEGEVNGADLVFLTVGYFSIDNGDEEAIGWAQDVIESHPDATIVLVTHNVVNGGANNWSNMNVVDNLITPYDNVLLTLGGHITATGVAATQNAAGGTSYGVLTDYQGRVYGGQEYYKHVSVDAENGLMYFNTYSPLLDTATSDGVWRQDVPEGAIPGMYGSDTENYVLEIDLGGTTTRTLDASGFTVAAGQAAQVGDPVQTVGSEPAEAMIEGLAAGTHEWYVTLTDQAGNTTRSAPRAFTVEQVLPPAAPENVTARADGRTVTVSWQSVDDAEEYAVELLAPSGRVVETMTVAGTEAVFAGVKAGRYTAQVQSIGPGGESDWSDPSDPVVAKGKPSWLDSLFDGLGSFFGGLWSWLTGR